MLKLQAFLMVFLTAPIFVFSVLGQQPTTPEQLLEAVHNNTDLSAAGPYTLTATVVVNPEDAKKQQTGQLRIDRDGDRFRVELTLPGYQEVRLTLGNKRFIHTAQATLFVTGLANFDRSWDPLKEDLITRTENLTWGNMSHKKIHGHEAQCFDQTRAQAPKVKTHYCIDPDRAVVLRRDLGDDRIEFFDYASAGSHMFPRKVTIRKPFINNLELRDISVFYQAVDPARFAVPEQSIQIETCPDQQEPKALFTPEPEFTNQARSMHRREQFCFMR